MNELLQLAVDRHGGVDRWSRIEGLVADVDLGGATFHLKGQPGVIGRHRATVDARSQSVVIEPLAGPRHFGRYTPECVIVEDFDGRSAVELEQPRTAFEGHSLTTRWEPVHLAYFVGYALWNYLTAPFSLMLPGVRAIELEPWNEAGEQWRKLRVSFPKDYATHNDQQIFYFDSEGLLRRRDYVADVMDPSAGGVWAAHYTEDFKEFGGLLFPTRRRIFALDEARRPVAEPGLISIDVLNIDVLDES